MKSTIQWQVFFREMLNYYEYKTHGEESDSYNDIFIQVFYQPLDINYGQGEIGIYMSVQKENMEF